MLGSTTKDIPTTTSDSWVQVGNGSCSGKFQMYTADTTTLAQPISYKGIIFDKSLISDSSLSGVKNNFVVDTFNNSGTTANVVFLPYRNLGTITYSAGTFSYNYITFSDGTNTYIIYLQWWTSDLTTFIGTLNTTRKARQTWLANVVKNFATYAQSYRDNVDFANAAAGGLTTINNQVTQQNTDINTTNAAILVAQTSLTAATTSYNNETTKLANLNANTSTLTAARDSINTIIAQTSDNITQLTNLQQSKNASQSTFTTTYEQNLADFNTNIALLLAEDPSLATVTQLALTNLQALTDPSPQFSLILPN